MVNVNKSEMFFIKLQKDKNVYDYSSVKKFAATEGFFEKLQQAYDSYDCGSIKDFLSDDFTYESFFEFNMIKSKDEYIEYLSDKLKDMKKHGYKEKLDLLYNSDTGEQVLIFTNKPVPKQSGEYVCFVAEANEIGLISKLKLTLSCFYDSLFLPKDAIEDLENMEVDVDDILPEFLSQKK